MCFFSVWCVLLLDIFEQNSTRVKKASFYEPTTHSAILFFFSLFLLWKGSTGENQKEIVTVRFKKLYFINFFSFLIKSLRTKFKKVFESVIFLETKKKKNRESLVPTQCVSTPLRRKEAQHHRYLRVIKNSRIVVIIIINVSSLSRRSSLLSSTTSSTTGELHRQPSSSSSSSSSKSSKISKASNEQKRREFAWRMAIKCWLSPG